jgi:hypothetical protein
MKITADAISKFFFILYPFYKRVYCFSLDYKIEYLFKSLGRIIQITVSNDTADFGKPCMCGIDEALFKHYD